MDSTMTCAFPCPCQVGPGKKISFQDLRRVLLETADKSTGVCVRTLAVSATSVNGGTRWLVDFESEAGSQKDDRELENAVQDLMLLFRGEVIGYGRDFIRVTIPGALCGSHIIPRQALAPLNSSVTSSYHDSGP